MDDPWKRVDTNVVPNVTMVVLFPVQAIPLLFLTKSTKMFVYLFRHTNVVIWDKKYMYLDIVRVTVMIFHTTFNNISAMSWRSVLLVEETEYPEKKITDLSQVTDTVFQIILYQVHLVMNRIEFKNLAW